MNLGVKYCTLVAMSLSTLVVAALPAQAQTVPAKPGLWAQASEAVLNGKKLPTLFDIKGVPEAKKNQLRQSMAAAGLPAGWNPSLSCEKATQVDLQEVLANMKAQGCAASITSQTADHISANLQCKSETGIATGTANVSGINSSSVTYVMNLTGTMYGQPMTYKATSINKFLGSDCSALPAGVDASMLSR
ncbi:DUF3617 family protein [Asticcacaulis benevestitus]|uniref:DUF3617 domain-containing protein n=1 Tax=Asticcacaulis benevestitus DSM 16100 = ATCC BAA-896 TaxID=1121022 RepID=V4QX93_9CAUL|nr:DUF3617 family protein [Asticcacaulis benevestitus]ESQ83768.1 hypothetical protein ABENE_20055 [Asticcacaulis benevestitus DSM 16100 = ATCC BAA-896]